MIFPCPGLAPLALGTLTAGFFLGAGSSSENDSHVASSRVTVLELDQQDQTSQKKKKLT